MFFYSLFSSLYRYCTYSPNQYLFYFYLRRWWTGCSRQWANSNLFVSPGNPSHKIHNKYEVVVVMRIIKTKNTKKDLKKTKRKRNERTNNTERSNMLLNNSPICTLTTTSDKTCTCEEGKKIVTPIRHASSSSSDKKRRKKKKVVTFDCIQVREYERIVGDNPSVSDYSGPPLSIGWRYIEYSTKSQRLFVAVGHD